MLGVVVVVLYLQMAQLGVVEPSVLVPSWVDIRASYTHHRGVVVVASVIHYSPVEGKDDDSPVQELGSPQMDAS